MLLNFVILTVRTFLKNRVTFFINLIGMSIAIGCCIAAYVNFEFNEGFDKFHVNASNLYRISFTHSSEGIETPYGVTPLPMPELIRENNRNISNVIRYISKSGKFRIGDEMFQREFVYADPTFTSTFTMTRRYGSLMLTDKSTVLISDKLATIYFGKADVVGQPLTQIISGSPREYIIGGVYQAFPFNSSFRFDLITTFENYIEDPAQRENILTDWKKWTTTFLEIRNPSEIDVIEKDLQRHISAQNDARPDLKASKFYIEPFVGMAGRAIKQKAQGHWLNMPMPPAAVIAPFFMAGFILLVACFNFTNNAIAVAGRRLKEIGIRKVVGGTRKQLIIQFLSETIFFCVISLMVALFLAEYFVAGWDSLWPEIELTIRYRDNWQFLVVLFGLILGTALFAGAYPAFYISSFRPINILRGTTRFGGTNLFTKSLLVFQVSISLAAVIFAMAFYNNSKFQKAFDLGYSYQKVVQVEVENDEQFRLLRDAVSSNSLIRSVSGSEHHIFASSGNARVRTEKYLEKEVDILDVGEDYFNTVNIRVVAGRGFQKEKASDYTNAIVVNEEFVRQMSLGPDPIDTRIVLNDSLPYNIVGIVKDVYLNALFEPLKPVAFRLATEDRYKYLIASTEPGNVVTLNGQMREAWKKLFPNQLYTGRLMEERMVMALEHFDNAIILYTFLGLVATIMSVSGLYSLVALHLQRRTKELGIRKILGASMPHVMYQSSKLFLVIMVLSFVIGSSSGSFLVNKLMDNIWEYYEAIDVLLLSTAIVLLFVIAATTVFFRVISAAKTNAVESLRHE